MRHSEIAMPSLVELLNEFDLKPRDLDEIIVNVGPGSFTGVRIGVVIAKTMAYLLNIPIKVINSIEMVAFSQKEVKPGYYALREKNGYFVAELDNNNQLSDIIYYSDKEYEDKFKDVEVIMDTLLDYDNIYNYVSTKEAINPHLVNPLYVKKIEVLK